MQIDILGGQQEIGGNKILLTHKDTKIFLDFGMSFNINGQYFSEFLQPRKANSLGDFFEFGLLPDIPNIYRNDYLLHMGRPEEEKGIDAILLSHAHADHASFIHFVRPDIPIGCTKPTKIILDVLEKTGAGTFNDLTESCDTFTYYTNKRDKLSRVTRRNKDFIRQRPFHILKPNDQWAIKDLTVEPVYVDHSLPGACGYIIYSDEGTLVYTGDLRFHGTHGFLSERFVERAASVNPRWLICEGTRIKDIGTVSECEVQTNISALIERTNGLVFVEHPIRDLDRTTTIYNAANNNNRKFVVTLKLAYLIQSLGDVCPFSLDDVKILIPKKSWGLIARKNIEEDELLKDYRTWEKEFVTHKNAISADELQRNPTQYVVSMNMWEISQMTDIQPENAIWIKSSCEPFNDDMELDEARKQNWLQHFNITEYSAHASGHASGREIRAMIRTINPEILIPVHTEHPEAF